MLRLCRRFQKLFGLFKFTKKQNVLNITWRIYKIQVFLFKATKNIRYSLKFNAQHPVYVNLTDQGEIIDEVCSFTGYSLTDEKKHTFIINRPG